MNREGEHRIVFERPLQQVRLLAVRERSKTPLASGRRTAASPELALADASNGSNSAPSDAPEQSVPHPTSHGRSVEETRAAEIQKNQTLLSAMDELIQNLHEQLNELESRRKASLIELQRVAIELAVAVAGHILRKEVAAGEYPLETLIREAIDRLNGQQMATVHVHPEDLSLLQSRGDVAAKFSNTVRWISDRTLPRGACLVESGDLGLTTNWSQHLEDIHRGLLEGLENAQTERRGSRETPEGMRRFPERRETA